MKRSRFTTEQIIGVLKEHQTGVKVPDLARKHGISGHTFYRWKAKYGGMEVSEAQRLKHLEDENRRLKHMVAEAERIDAVEEYLSRSLHRITWHLFGAALPSPRTPRAAVVKSL